MLKEKCSDVVCNTVYSRKHTCLRLNCHYRGKFDNGGRFDLRLPYADQGYVDEDADVMGKLASFFGGGKKKTEPQPEQEEEEPPKKKSGFPW